MYVENGGYGEFGEERYEEFTEIGISTILKNYFLRKCRKM
jgi:hypothetical protein